MKKQSKFKRWIRRNKVGLLLLALFCFPLGVGAIYALPLPRIINVEAGDLLAYYGTTFGIIGSFVAYRIELKKKEKEKITELKPVFYVSVELIDKNKGLFKIDISNHSKQMLSYLYLYDEFITPIAKKDHSFQVTYNKTTAEIETAKPQFNITMDPDIIDRDGYPRYVQLICDDKEGNAWDCCYHKVKDCDKIYYYPRDFEII